MNDDELFRRALTFVFALTVTSMVGALAMTFFAPADPPQLYQQAISTLWDTSKICAGAIVGLLGGRGQR